MATVGQIIDGKAISEQVKSKVKEGVSQMIEKGYRAPMLVVVLVGSRKDSMTYVRSKKKVAADLGIVAIDKTYPETVTQDELLQEVRSLNKDDSIDGILVQLPLPSHINEEAILTEIDISKDVDGFHPINIGKLAMKGREPEFEPCTPRGCIELLDRTGIQIEGKNAVILGRSNIVGLPVSMMLLKRNATVTICHSKTPNLPEKCREADILIVAIGQAKLVKKDWVKPGAAVIDVGMNTLDNGKLCGDVDFEDVKPVASHITPVPGGVGPMTIAMLLNNTLKSAQKKLIK
ncbi:methenyl tetrahydrofolate cyclohydrolase / NADP-dependent methylene H4F dehydrogenase [Tieghemostelium lacteum]|uniref:Methenyl tetrahydrofolate cyclohydrolase / NADP-dependent methylene H4F dehydrogenase n=1 Tax=Tieghemostelium lacteum TaxID=361077 RepID=A0A151Z9K8_TIELA|nr:methenyl tetrahydrofolate cyclohydrolase / NADP-dependent methylene H4F dehydrogenase [Tieghemostelium lacteum]|eukprot:KYQ90622.1 methenyl tetrahydrofolate cyclohydrolase / NADP-dependent methylene H4F dehydrogenase [Tieghemostelium lacteum]